MNRKTIWVKIIFGLAVGLLTLFMRQSGYAQKAPQEITILHTNDMHGAYLPSKATWEQGNPMVGGFEALSHYARTERQGLKRSLLFDCGDLMTGTLICDIPYEGAEGGALVAMMNRIGYDGWVFGNHEFDKPASNLRALIKIAKFPVFCADLANDNKLFTSEPHHIYNLDGLRVGVIGLTYHQMLGMASGKNLEGYRSVDPVEAVKKEVAEIDSLTDLIIVLSHLGIENDSVLAANTHGVDLILGGHSHTRLESPWKVNGVQIAQTGSNCRNLGRIDLTVVGDSIMAINGKLIAMYTKDIKPDTVISQMVSRFKAEIDSQYAIVIAELKVPTESNYRAESNIGNWLTDVLRNRMNTEIGILNSGGIRKNLSPGPVTKMDILEMLPFDNQVVTFTCTGADLQKLAEANIGSEQGGSHGSLQLSGLTYKWKLENSKPKVVEIRVNNKKIKKSKIYTVSSIDYIASSNAMRYMGFEPKDIKADYYLKLSDLIMQEAEKVMVIEPKVEGRIKKIE